MKKRATAAGAKEDEITERTAPSGQIVYEAIYREGEHELTRNGLELGLSGLAAGLSMGFSMLGEALLRAHLPDAPWTPLIAKLGYSIGFLIVILGRQQLFTKNTLTVILPLLKTKKLALLGKVGRLWVIVLAANLVGAFLFAWFIGLGGVLHNDVREVLYKIGTSTIAPGFSSLVLRGIVAGWLIALMVWLLPFAESAHVWVIIFVSYLVGLAELPHIIAGNVETFFMVTNGAMSLRDAIFAYLVPTLIGNVIGGVALVAVGAHAEFNEVT